MPTPRSVDPEDVFRPPAGLADPHGLPSKQMHIRWNDWEHEQIQRHARFEGMSMQAWVRTRLRKTLLAEPMR